MSENFDNKLNIETAQSPLEQLLDALVVWKKFIVLNTLIIAILCVGITLLMPNYYKSTASILPPKQQDLFGTAVGASSLLRGITGSTKLLGNLGRSSGTYNYLAILKSRTTMDEVIKKFDLQAVYNIDSTDYDKVVKELEDNTFFEVQDDENITVDVYDKDPQRAADMANYFVELLNRTSIRLSTLEAKNNREFIERRLMRCRADLKNAEDAMKVFQEKKEIFISDNSEASSVSAYAELYTLKAKKEIEIGVLEKTVSPDNQLLRQLKAELAEINKKVSDFPEAGLEAVRLYREVVIQSKLLEFLLPIYEQAKIDEQKDVPVLLVIDQAIPATKKAKPRRTLIILTITFIFFVMSVLASVIFNSILKNPSAAENVKMVKHWIYRIMSFYRTAAKSETR